MLSVPPVHANESSRRNRRSSSAARTSAETSPNLTSELQDEGVSVRPRSGLKHLLKIYYKTGRQRRCVQHNNPAVNPLLLLRFSQAPEAFQGSQDGWGSEVEAETPADFAGVWFRHSKRASAVSPPQHAACQGEVDAVCMSMPGLSTPVPPFLSHPLRGSGTVQSDRTDQANHFNVFIWV